MSNVNKNISFIEPNRIKQWIIQKEWKKIEYYLKTIPQKNYRSWEYLAEAFIKGYKYFNYEDLENNFNNAYTVGSNDINFLNIYSELLLIYNKQDKALVIATKAVSKDQNNPIASIALAKAAQANGKYKLAFNSAKKAYKNLPAEQKKLKKQMDEIMIKLSPIWWEKLEGKRIVLSRILPKHQDFIFKLRNNEKFKSLYNIFLPTSKEEIQKDILFSNKPPIEIRKIEWIIEKDNNPIGIAGLSELDWHNKNAELQIGFPDNLNSKIALETAILILNFAFNKIFLEKLTTYVYSNNLYAQKSTLNLGFHQEGYLKSHIYDLTSKKRLDIFVNGLIAKDFFNNKKLQKLAFKLLGKNINQ